VGTWNVLSLYRCGALQNLIKLTKEYKTDLLAIKEVRWLGRSIIEKKDCTAHYSCDYKQHIFGTGFIVSKSIRLIIDFKPLDRRMCVCLELQVNLKTTATSVPMHQQRKRVKEKVPGL
jgi:hypothetical protein